MDAVSIAVSLATVGGFLVTLAGIVYVSGKSSGRAEESRKLILVEETARKDEIKRIDALILAKETDSKERAKTNEAFISSVRIQLQSSFDSFRLSREQSDQQQAIRAEGLSNSQAKLGSDFGELKGTIMTFIGEMRTREK